MEKMLLVFNPVSGHGELTQKLFEVVDLFTRSGYEVTVHPTATGGDALSYIKDRGPDFDLIVCSGGDGMIHEVVNAYLQNGIHTPLGYIPTGTTNDFAASLGLPRNIMEAALSILNSQPRVIDAGVFNDKFFAYVAAFGLFTNIPYTADQNVKNIFGSIVYYLEGLKQLTAIPSISCRIEADGEVIEGDFMLGVVANGTSIAGLQPPVESGAAIDDGLFEVYLVRPPKNPIELQEIINGLFGNQTDSQVYIQRKVREVKFSSVQPCEWTLDGEFGGQYTDVYIENLHHVFSIL